MKIYYPSSHYNKTYRVQVFPLLKPFIKGENFTDENRREMYGVSAKDYYFVNNMVEAELVVLPMAWNYYVQTNQLHLAYKLVKEAEKADKRVWSWNAGDYGVKIPEFKNLNVFRMSGYGSRKQRGHEGLPSMIKDRLEKYSKENFSDFPDNKQPIVGFCGQADAAWSKALQEQTKIIYRNLKSLVGLSPHEPQTVVATTKLRASLLAQLERHPKIRTNFILRKKYRAGVSTPEEREKTTQEFYQNINSSQYVLCVRGAGNFSVRFYETLMMGRIPLYVHTDGFLPLSNKIDWKHHVVWVDEKEIDQLGEKLVKFHQERTQKDLLGIAKKNRQLWKDYLTLDGFFKSSYQMHS